VQHVGLEPQALEVADLAGGAVVLVGGAAVQHVEVVDELDVTGLQVHEHVVVGFGCHRLDGAERLDLDAGEARRVGVAL
jgi:hypothetical protein